MERFNFIVRDRFPEAEFIRARGEEIPRIVEQQGGYGWTGNDLYRDYLAAEKGNALRQVSFFPWPVEKKPKLCLLGPREQTLNAFEKKLGISYGCVRIAVADKYQNLAWQYFWEKGWTPQVRLLSGQVDRMVRAWEADLAVDIVCTGRTMREERLAVYDTIFDQSGLVLLAKDERKPKINKQNNNGGK